VEGTLLHPEGLVILIVRMLALVVLAVVLHAMVLVMMLLVMLLVVLASVAVVRRWGRNGLFRFLGFLGLLRRLVQVSVSPEDNLDFVLLLFDLQVKTLRTLLVVIILIIMVAIILRQVLGNVSLDPKSRRIHKEARSNDDIGKDITLSNGQFDIKGLGYDVLGSIPRDQVLHALVLRHGKDQVGLLFGGEV
jgi:hypothetical protein